ncbi:MULTISPECIES: dTDP-glucose 4,6-dehydratase [Snodgrassella]|uniref:dTDP-glucose 4,6-dehydratase n=1 Tax=Snodgrassella TaxID=1193515 RepID=UPI000815A69E|nr:MULTISPECIES: dTDP-glucose 4,6-dehydratase [Snodgrassella]SCC01642.1 dTDP-glucose 4,6-dehydratase [Snodgrassella sp. R-53583]
MKFLITGGAGFIGSAMIRFLINRTDHCVLNIDKLTYAGNLNSLSDVVNCPRYQFSATDICNQTTLTNLFNEFKPNIVMHFAAETHVDRSIDTPSLFIKTNIVGTFTLLEVIRNYFHQLSHTDQQNFRFHHISTDEVYGDLQHTMSPCTELSAYSPSSPYSASKASADHLVRAWNRTYDLPVVISHCTNNFGPYQHPEKLIPLTILNALNHKPIPVYGNGKQVRDWLYVTDHVDALYAVANSGRIGETYHIGGYNEYQNIEVIHTICDILSQIKSENYTNLITYTTDRQGHDFRYALDTSKIKSELNWRPKETFHSGLYKTITWYLNNQQWIKSLSHK